MGEVRALIEWVAAGLVAGELGAALGWLRTRMALGVAAAAILASLASARLRPLGIGAIAMAVGAQLVARAAAPSPAIDDVAHLALPQRIRLLARVGSSTVGETTSAVVDALAVGWPARVVSGRVRLRVRGRVPLAPGDVIEIETTLRRPRNFENPGRIDVAGRLARHGIHVAASIWSADDVVVLAAPPAGFLDRWRAAVRAVVGRVRDPDVAAVLLALVLGDEAQVDPTLRDAFSRAGVIHVLSVSGLHVSIVAGGLATLLAWVASRSERILLYGDPRKVAVAGGLVAALVYGALTGLAVATVRSIAMAGVVTAAVVLDRRAAPWRAFALAALAIALLEPGAPADASFQLSFVSVGALLATAAPSDPRRGAWVRRAARASCAAWVGTAPLTALHFHQVSLVGVVANPLVIPLFEGAAVLPALIGAVLAPVTPALAHVAMELAGLPVRVALALVRSLGTWTWAAIDVPIPSPLELGLAYGLVVTATMRGPRARRLCAACTIGLALDAAWWAHERCARDGVRATFLDVGQGDAAVVEMSGGRVLVIDAGGFAGSDFDTGAALVEPFLRTRHVGRVDALVMSHAHPDHAGGLAHLVRHLGPAELWWSGHGGTGAAWAEIARALVETGTPVRVLRTGMRVPDFPEIDVLHPPSGWSEPSLNDGSLVLRIRDGGTSMLFTGDAEHGAETAMLFAPDVLAASVLKVPHHGSLTSSSAGFLAAVGPRAAIASAGADNRFGHPAPAVEARYRAAGIAFYRTDRCGAVTLDATSVTTAVPDCGRR